ncbi:MAG TPA: Lrp/AsnC family transcriptional regulator [Streptosporangiaceae bacterium]
MKTDQLDEIDRGLVHALQLDGRAPFAVIAAALGVSDHTIARRYRQLRSQGVLRVVGLPDSERLGWTDWFIRLRCVPDSALPIARALARRDDISWVMLTSAGAEITCQASVGSRGQRDALLLGTLPRSRQIVQVDALSVLRTFFGGASGWNGRTSALTEDQAGRIAGSGHRRPSPAEPVVLDAQDEKLLAEVRKDGRIAATDLAAILGCSAPAASRRLDRLIASGALFFDVEIAPEHLGYQVEALLWVTVAPGRLEDVATTAAQHPQVALATATSGATNLLLAVGCRDQADLYDYVAHGLGPIEGVQAVQTAPIIRTVKRAGTLIEPA